MKLAMAFTVAVLIAAGTMAPAAAQIQFGASNLRAQVQQVDPGVTQVGCAWVWRYGRRVWICR
jgi:hypothetical protein